MPDVVVRCLLSYVVSCLFAFFELLRFERERKNNSCKLEVHQTTATNRNGKRRKEKEKEKNLFRELGKIVDCNFAFFGSKNAPAIALSNSHFFKTGKT